MKIMEGALRGRVTKSDSAPTRGVAWKSVAISMEPTQRRIYYDELGWIHLVQWNGDAFSENCP